jgi:hypothetical protein
MGAPRLLAPTTISGGIPTAGAGTLNTVALWTPDGFTLGNSLLTQAGSVITNATGAIRANGTSQTSPAFMRHDATNTGIYFPSLNEIGFTINNQHAMFIGSTRYVGIGTASPDSRLHALLGTVSVPIAALRIGFNGTSNNFIDADTQTFRNAATTATYGQFTSTALNISNVFGYGLKLPATPGNPDTQTLDAYQESTAWTPVVTGAGGTTPTVFASTCTRIGRLVICNIVLTATGGNTYSSTYSTTTINLPVAAAALCAATLAQGTNAVPNATVSGGNILLPTFALTTVATVVTALYYV